MKKYIIMLLLIVGLVLNLNAIPLRISTLDGKKNISLEIDENITIKDLQDAIHQNLQIEPEKQMLVSKAKKIDDRFQTLKDSGWQTNDVIYVLIRSDMAHPESSLPQPSSPQKAFPQLSMRQKVGAGALSLAVLTGVLASVMKVRSYNNARNQLIRKYNLAALTPLQNKVWIATVLASHWIPWYLDYIVRHTQASLADLIGADPRALAELYYGHVPTANKVDAFLRRFFPGKAIHLPAIAAQ